MSAQTSPSIVVQNLTGKHIRIAAKESEASFVMPPFGEREMTPAEFSKFNFCPWLERDLICVDAPGLPVTRCQYSRVRQQMTAQQHRRSQLLACTGRQLISIVAIVLIAFGLPLLLIGWPSTNYAPQWLGVLGIAPISNPFNQAVAWNDYLPRAIFIAAAAMLPAVLYYLFVRLQWRTHRLNLLQQITLLDPSIETLDDAEQVYGGLVNECYLGAQSGLLGGLQVTLLISTILITLGWSMALLPIDRELQRVFTPPIVAGFLGAYFFAVNLIFRRYVRADLSHKAYSHISLRIICTFILVWIISGIVALTSSTATQALTPQPTTVAPLLEPTASMLEQILTARETLLPLVVTAFIIGIFPEVGLMIIRQYLSKVLHRLRVQVREEHPLTELIGVTIYDQARFLEEGVENVENLAHSNPVELMCLTRLPAARLVYMIDQALLHLQVSGLGIRPPENENIAWKARGQEG
jgi:hypothetical protein